MPNHFHAPKSPAATRQTKEKPVLRMVQLPIFRVRAHALEDFLLQVYGMEDFNFTEATGYGAGTFPEYVVATSIPLGQDAERRAQNIRAGRRCRDVTLILTTLCLDGYIPQGKYIIDTRPRQSLLDVYKELLAGEGDPDAAKCAAFKKKHGKDKAFLRSATLLDTQVREFLARGEKRSEK